MDYNNLPWSENLSVPKEIYNEVIEFFTEMINEGLTRRSNGEPIEEHGLGIMRDIKYDKPYFFGIKMERLVNAHSKGKDIFKSQEKAIFCVPVSEDEAANIAIDLNHDKEFGEVVPIRSITNITINTIDFDNIKWGECDSLGETGTKQMMEATYKLLATELAKFEYTGKCEEFSYRMGMGIVKGREADLFFIGTKVLEVVKLLAKREEVEMSDFMCIKKISKVEADRINKLLTDK